MNKRSILKICFLIAAIVTVVAPSQAQGLNLAWSGGISITEMTPQSGVFSHIDMASHGQIIGSWFSTAGILPVLVKANNLDYVAYGDFPGVTKIERVVLTPDGGATQWPASQILGKGWHVDIPMGMKNQTTQTIKDERISHGRTERVICEEQTTTVGLEPGGYALEWGVYSRDKHNRLMLIIIPISYSSTRVSSAANHVMVQREGIDIGCLNELALGVYLSEHGFKSATDGLSPAVAAAQQMGQSQQSQPQPAPQPQVQPVVPQPQAPVQPPVYSERQGTYVPASDGTANVEEVDSSSTITVTLDVQLVRKTIDQDGRTHFFLIHPGEQKCYKESRVDSAFKPNQDVRVWRNNRCVAEAKIGKISEGSMNLYVVGSEYLQAGDDLKPIGEGK